MTKRITVFAIQYTFFSLAFGCISKMVKKLFENAKVGTEIAKQTNPFLVNNVSNMLEFLESMLVAPSFDILNNLTFLKTYRRKIV